MVASRSRIHGFDDVQLSSSKSVVRYDGNNPASIRQFGLIIRAVLEEKGVLDAVILADQSFDEWLRASGDYSKKDKESLEAYAEYKEEVRVKRKRAYTVMLQWPGVLNPRIMDLCEQSSSPLSRMCGASLYTELMKPSLFATPRHQDALLANLAKVHQFANAPGASASPLSADPTHEEVISFLEAFWLTWKLVAENDELKPYTFVITSYKVLRTLSALRTHVDMQLELYLKSDRSLSGRTFIDEVSAETRNALPTEESLVPARLVDEGGGLHAFTQRVPSRRPAIPSNGRDEVRRDGGPGGRPPFRRDDSRPSQPGLFQRQGIVVACRFCDCYACSNTANGGVEGCGACGQGQPRRDATAGKLRHLNLCRAHARKHGLKTLKGKDLRAILNALIDDVAGGADESHVGDEEDVDNLDDAALAALINDLELEEADGDGDASLFVHDAPDGALDEPVAFGAGLFVLESPQGGTPFSAGLDGVRESLSLTPAQSRALDVGELGSSFSGPDGIELRSLEPVGPATATMFMHVCGADWRRWWRSAKSFGRFSRDDCLQMTSPASRVHRSSASRVGLSGRGSTLRVVPLRRIAFATRRSPSSARRPTLRRARLASWRPRALRHLRARPPRWLAGGGTTTRSMRLSCALCFTRGVYSGATTSSSTSWASRASQSSQSSYMTKRASCRLSPAPARCFRCR